MDAGFVFDLEQVDFLGARERNLSQLDFVVSSVAFKLFLDDNLFLGDFLDPRNKQVVELGVVGHRVVDSAFFQVREGLVGYGIATKELVVCRNQDIAV